MRRNGDRVPVIVTTARGTLVNRVTGLDEGADDYIVKPFAIEELAARVRALLRRPNTDLALFLSLANLKLTLSTARAAVDEEPLVLSRSELKVLGSLMRSAGRVVLREDLENDLYAFGDEVSSNALDAHIHRLRSRLKIAGANVAIVTVRGVGYLIKAV